jgi:PilZ domain
MDMQDRRRVPRQSTMWMGYCHVEGEIPLQGEGESSRLWRGCGVFDLSTLGLGMDFRHQEPNDLVGRHITVRLPVGGSVDITLTGEVRNTKAGPDGVVRAGIEFVGLSEEELYILDILEVDTLSDLKA